MRHGENRCILIEQPEIHLHPEQQAHLGEVFAKSALDPNFGSFNTLLIETHSIHVLERLGKMIRETAEGEPRDGIAVRPEDVAVYYVDPYPEGGSGGVELLTLSLLDDGRLDPQFQATFSTRI